MDPTQSQESAGQTSPVVVPPHAQTVIERLLSAALRRNVTDIHLEPGDGGIWFRMRGDLVRQTDEKECGFPLGVMSQKDYDVIRSHIYDGRTNLTSMYTAGAKQIRVHCPGFQSASLLIRIQDVAPPPLAKVVGTGDFFNSIVNTKGLTLVVGPQGGGKSTLAGGITREWAERHGHVVTLEDPIEYKITSNKGRVSQAEVRLSETSGKGMPLSAAVDMVMRADARGIFIGEIRNVETLRAALALGRNPAPILSTFHASSIAAAIRSLYTMPGMAMENARVEVPSVLTSVIYVNLAYTKLGLPVPVVMAFHTESSTIKTRLAEGSPTKISALVEEILEGKDGSSSRMAGEARPGMITREMAKKRAIEVMYATEESVEAALPSVGAW